MSSQLSTMVLRVVLIAVLGLGVTPRVARACATAPPPGASVTIRGEEAVIVWDAEAKVEHFIRRADFDTEARDFGFIVPTPSPPELAEVPDGLFDTLAEQTRPRVITQYQTSGVTLSSWFLLSARDSSTAGPGTVEVLRRQRVAGYDAVVLKADDAGALARWLDANGYARSESLEAWATPYIEQGFTFTAFTLAATDGGVSTAAVRMSFETDAPMYPYREPRSADASAEGTRVLRVFFVAEGRYDATFENTPWSAETIVARALPESALKAVLPAIAPTSAYLTVWLDRQSPRPGTADVYFAPSSAAGDVEPEPVVHTIRRPLALPGELMALVVLIGGVVIWRRRRG